MGGLRRFLGGSTLDQDEIEMEGNTQPIVNIATGSSSSQAHLKLGPDRVYNKPVKIFKKEGTRITRQVHEKDVLNMFEQVEVDNKRVKTSSQRGSSMT